MKHLRPAIALALLLLVITGLLYPGVITALGNALFPHQAQGSLVRINGRVVGSELIAQGFTQPHYFHPRGSAAGAGYDPTASAGTNKGPTDRKLADTLIAASVAEAGQLDHVPAGQVPADRATRSASGLDPHISARGVTAEQVRALVRAHTKGRQLGFLGEPRVNVLMLNIALDETFGARQ
jgi:K+-transporting ATPase ATPase C chain